MTITRQKFTKAIKAGLVAATPKVKAAEPKLMKLAETATATRVFGFGYYQEVKCPLSAVGLYKPGDGVDWGFVDAFDRTATSGLNGCPYDGILRIID